MLQTSTFSLQPYHYRPYLSPLLRYPSIASQLRYPHHPDAVGALKLENDDDLYPLCSGQDGERGDEPAGFLIRRFLQE